MTTRTVEQQAQETAQTARHTATSAGSVVTGATGVARGAVGTAGMALADATHAVVGAVDLAVAKVRGRSVAELGSGDDALVPRTRDAYDRLSTRGRRVTGRLRRRADDELAEIDERVASGVDSVADRAEHAIDTGRDVVAEPGRNDLHQPGVPYEDRTVEDLRALAAERRIDGRSTMSKTELVAALRT